MSPTPSRAPRRPPPAAGSASGFSAALLGALLLCACPGPGPGTADAGCDLPCGEVCCQAGAVCLGPQGCCTPDCEGKECGDDGCGGSCALCEDGLACSEQFHCVSLPRDAGPRRDASLADAGPGPGPDAGPVGPPVPFRVMNWNVRDLFDEVDDPSKDDTVLSASQVSSKLAKLAAEVNSEAPDILTLQEVETKALLGRLNDALTKKLPHYELLPGNDPRGINVAIMSRFPLLAAISHKNERFYSPDGHGAFYYSRDCLEAHLDLGGNRELAVLVNHQVSQLDDSVNTENKRQAQALHTRELADALRAATPWVAVLIVGDMNDDPDSASMGLYLAGGQWIDFWAGLPLAMAYTYKTGSNGFHRLDYVLPDAVTATWKTAARLVGTAGSSSDHSAVVVDFVYP